MTEQEKVNIIDLSKLDTVNFPGFNSSWEFIWEEDEVRWIIKIFQDFSKKIFDNSTSWEDFNENQKLILPKVVDCYSSIDDFDLASFFLKYVVDNISNYWTCNDIIFKKFKRDWGTLPPNIINYNNGQIFNHLNRLIYEKLTSKAEDDKNTLSWLIGVIGKKISWLHLPKIDLKINWKK